MCDLGFVFSNVSSYHINYYTVDMESGESSYAQVSAILYMLYLLTCRYMYSLIVMVTDSASAKLVKLTTTRATFISPRIWLIG